MSFVHGKNCGVLVDEYDLTSYLNQASAAFDLQTVDVTPFGADDHQYLGGLKSGTLSLSGMFDAANSDTVLNTAFGSANVITVAFPSLATLGNQTYMAKALTVEYQPRASVSDAVRITANNTGSGVLRSGVLLHELTAETSVANFTSDDNAAASANGAVANLHVTAFSGTSATIKVTDSTDNNTFADLITFASVTAAGSEHSSVTGTVNRYARVELSGTFTSVTFAVSFARN